VSITIVTVVLNAVATIEESIQSVLRMKTPQLEYIVLDGGSSDGTLEVLVRYSSEFSYWESKKDSGIYHAMNRGLSLATGDWLLFLGSDDFLVSDIDRIGKSYFSDERALYYGNVIMKSSGKSYSGKVSRAKILTQNICQQAIFYPRSYYSNHSFDVRYPIAADYAYNLKIFGNSDNSCVHIPVSVALFDDSGVSSRKTDLTFRKDKFGLICSYFPLAYSIIVYPVVNCLYLLFRLQSKIVAVIRKLL